MPRSDEQLPAFVKITKQFKNASSGPWHAFPDQPGKLYIGLTDLFALKDVLTEKGKRELNIILMRNFKEIIV